MTIEIDEDHFVARCDDNPGCAYNVLLVKRYPAQLQQAISLDLAPPLVGDGSLHADDARDRRRRRDPRKALTKIERRQLEAFARALEVARWVVRADRARPLGYLTICHNHNPATIHRRFEF